MEVLKFTLSGKDAFFRKPEVNTYYYFTYGNLHKVALLGIFGAILGYNGYGQMKPGDRYPEFYDMLKDLEISIAPAEKSKGTFSKKIQSFNNSVGYASTEQGGNLIVKQQWLEEPKWEIYVKLDHEEGVKIKDFLTQRRCIYLPYLGSNDHPADLGNVQVCQAQLVSDMEEKRIHSLFLKDKVSLDFDEDVPRPYLYEEYLPKALKETTNLYELEKFYFSNIPVEEYDCAIYEIEERNIVFF